MDLLVACVLFYLQANFIVTGLQPLKRFKVITYLLRVSHLIWLCTTVFLMFYRRLIGGDISVGGLVGTASFVFNGSVNIIILLECTFKNRHFHRIFELEKEIDQLMETKWTIKVRPKLKYNRMMLRILCILCIQFVCEGLKMWINAISRIQPVFWYSFLTTVSLRARYVQIIAIIMTLNGRLEIFKEALIAYAKNNEPRSQYVSEIWQPYTAEEYDNVNYMRLIYLRIWEMYRTINDCFSWSMLSLFMSSFFDIVCNCYWTFTALYKRQKFHKYVFNGASSMSLASLVVMLFYCTHISDGNFSLSPTVIMWRTQNRFFYRSESTAYNIIIFCSYLVLWLFALTPLTNSNLIYQLFILLWCGEIVVACSLAIVHDIIDNEDSLNGVVESLVFIVHVGGHFVILMNSWTMRDYRRPIYEIMFPLTNARLIIPFDKNKIATKLMTMVILFGCLLSVGHGLVIWTTFESKSNVSGLYWHSLPSVLALQFKTLEFLLAMEQANYCIRIVRQNINEIGERNLKRVFKTAATMKTSKKVNFIMVLPQRQDQEDERQVEILKNAYNDIYAMFQLFNRAYGWTLLAETTVYFVVFVCNTYWIIFAIISQSSDRDYYTLLQNACFLFLGFVMLTLLCWMCEQSAYESRYIGCLISKLVKPLGNKRYNDLVSEFSVQTLHQRFIITAKEFFVLNLGLLGSMVAAIVTYLVILIQFMFTEKSNNENKLSTKVSSGRALLTTTAIPTLSAVNVDDKMSSPSSQTIGDNFTSSIV